MLTGDRSYFMVGVGRGSKPGVWSERGAEFWIYLEIASFCFRQSSSTLTGLQSCTDAADTAATS